MITRYSTSGIKVASVLKNVNIDKGFNVSNKLDIRRGSVLLVSIMEVNQKYGNIELTSGRIVPLHKYDKVVCAVGDRMASDGMCGIVPDKNISIGSEIAVLNLGGVVGKQIAYNRMIGSPTYCKIIGQVSLDDGKPINIQDYKIIDDAQNIDISTPVIGYLGTSMNSGKSTVMSNIINVMKNNNINVASIKATGVSTQRDVSNFLDYGATVGSSFLDCGLLSTCVIDSDSVIKSTKNLINHASKQDDIDIIFVEFGDSIYGRYNVKETLQDSEIKKCFDGFVLCGYDIPGSIQLYKNVIDMGLKPLMLSGPVTNNMYTLSWSLEEFDVKIPLFDNINVINPNIGALQLITDLIKV